MGIPWLSPRQVEMRQRHRHRWSARCFAESVMVKPWRRRWWLGIIFFRTSQNIISIISTIYLHISTYIYIYLHISTYIIYLHISTYIYIYICMYIYINNHKKIIKQNTWSGSNMENWWKTASEMWICLKKNIFDLLQDDCILLSPQFWPVFPKMMIR